MDSVLCVRKSSVLSRENQLIDGGQWKMPRNVLLCFSE